MRKTATLTSVAVALFSIFGQQAQAMSIHGSFLVSCPQGSALGDGCPQNPGGTFLAVASPSLWSAYARTSGQTWAGGAHPWSWNAPGIDYAAGPYTAPQDPATATMPAGCTYEPTGSTFGGAQVDCSNVTNLTLRGLDFRLHNGVQLVIRQSVGGVLTVDNCWFQNGTNLSQVHATVIGTLNGTAPTQLTVTSVVSGAIQNGDNLQGGNIDSWYAVSGSGGVGAYPISGGRCLNATPCATGSMTYYAGKVIGAPINVLNTNTALTTINFTHDYFNGDGTNYPMSFNEFINIGATSASVLFDDDVFLRMPTRPVTITPIAPYAVMHSYFEDFCYNGTDGHCEFSVHNTGSGQTQPLQQWSYDVFLQGKTGVFPGGTALAWLGTATDNTGVITNTYVDHTIFVANCVPNGPGNEGENPTASACSGGGYPVTAQDVAIQDATYTNSSMTSNFFDATGAFHRTATLGQSQCTNPTIWSGNVDLVTGAAVTAWDSKSAGAGNC